MEKYDIFEPERNGTWRTVNKHKMISSEGRFYLIEDVHEQIESLQARIKDLEKENEALHKEGMTIYAFMGIHNAKAKVKAAEAKIIAVYDECAEIARLSANKCVVEDIFAAKARRENGE